MEALELVVKFFTEGFMADIFNWFLGLLAFWGAADLYMAWRMRRHDKVDKSAIVGNWFTLKWMLASQTDKVVEKLPFLSKDLSENVGVKEDDGKVS
jgi:hypothetical protein